MAIEDWELMVGFSVNFVLEPIILKDISHNHIVVVSHTRSLDP